MQKQVLKEKLETQQNNERSLEGILYIRVWSGY